MPVFLIVESDQQDQQRLEKRYSKHGTVLVLNNPGAAIDVIDNVRFDYVAVVEHRLHDPTYRCFLQALRARFSPTQVPLLFAESLRFKSSS